jgi:hypothetical protein
VEFLKKGFIIIVIAVLLTLTMIQVLVDYKYEENLEKKLSASVKDAEYVIYIQIDEKMLYLLQNNRCVKKYPIASGKPGWPSPLGCWKIINKGDWGEGFGGRWMGLNVPWGKYGIHGTSNEGSIGYNASHGCIRMFNRHVRELYNIVPHGTPVVIVEGCFGPFGRGFRSLQPGDRGADVMSIQKRLKQLGYFKGWISGIYNDDLKYAVHRFQKNNGLAVSNTISKKCWQAMGFREFE